MQQKMVAVLSEEKDGITTDGISVERKKEKGRRRRRDLENAIDASTATAIIPPVIVKEVTSMKIARVAVTTVIIRNATDAAAVAKTRKIRKNDERKREDGRREMIHRHLHQ